MSLPPPIIPDSKAAEEMYRALGKALTRWQYIETGLYLIAHCLMETGHQVSSLAFFQIKSAETKLAFVDRLIFAKLTQHERTKYWEPIRKDIGKAIDFRNHLAHFEIFYLDEKHMSEVSPPTKYPVVLSYHHLDQHNRRGELVKSIAVEGIEHNSEALMTMTYALIYFVLDHVPHLERGAASLPPHLQQYLDSFRRTTRPPEFPPPPKSSHS
jgi:hypothetical protein